MAYTTQANLERAVGGAAVLAQLLDKDGDGVADEAAVSDLLDRADAEVNSAIQVCVDIAALSVPYPSSVVFAATDVAAYHAFLSGTSGLGMPAEVKARYDATLRWLSDVAERRRTVGVATKPATDHDVQRIDPDPDGTLVSRTSLRGFW